MVINSSEIKMLRESLADLEYLIEKFLEPELNQSLKEQRDRCKGRLAELGATQDDAAASQRPPL
jgi:hypothetical protein